jgi:type IV secretory pathway VirJ component
VALALLFTTSHAQAPPSSLADSLLAGRFDAARTRVSAGRDPDAGASGSGDRAEATWIRLAALDWPTNRSRDLPDLPAARIPASIEIFERGWLAARAAWPGADRDLMAAARAAAEALETRGGLEAQRFQALVVAAMAAAEEERDVLRLALAQAADLEMRLRMARTELPPYFALDRLAGDLWLQVHRFEDARQSYRAAVAREPRDARAWLGIARAAARLEDAEDAARAAATFLTLWANADVDRPELAAARSVQPPAPSPQPPAPASSPRLHPPPSSGSEP